MAAIVEESSAAHRNIEGPGDAVAAPCAVGPVNRSVVHIRRGGDAVGGIVPDALPATYVDDQLAVDLTFPRFLY
ncbi:MAG: hypothetical protein ACYTGG_11045 [Planctomycetota bacterium]|jgi:hypothetical protein